MADSSDLAFLKRISLATGPDGTLNPELVNSAVDDFKERESRVPELCKCGRGWWQSLRERVRGAVSSDGSSRLPSMSVESWQCTGCNVKVYPGSVENVPK